MEISNWLSWGKTGHWSHNSKSCILMQHKRTEIKRQRQQNSRAVGLVKPSGDTDTAGLPQTNWYISSKWREATKSTVTPEQSHGAEWPESHWDPQLESISNLGRLLVQCGVNLRLDYHVSEDIGVSLGRHTLGKGTKGLFVSMFKKNSELILHIEGSLQQLGKGWRMRQIN